MTLVCPECGCTFEAEDDLEPGDIIGCPEDCDGAYLVEDDISMTAGQIGAGGEFEVEEDDDFDDDDEDS